MHVLISDLDAGHLSEVFCLFRLAEHACLCFDVTQQYKWHEPSREAIEMAFDKLLQVGVLLRVPASCDPPAVP